MMNDNVLYIFEKNLKNIKKSKLVLVKDDTEILEQDDCLILHYSDDWRQYVDLVLPPNIRNPKKLMSLSQCWDVIERLDHGTITFSTDGYPYSFGMNHILLDGHIYFHCGPKGYKLEGIGKKVTFNFIEDLGLNFEIGTHNHRSVSVYGTMKKVEDVALKREILLKMLEDLKVKHVWHERMPVTTNILEIEIEYMTGKEHHPGNYY